jgi:hypothetical protein
MTFDIRYYFKWRGYGPKHPTPTSGRVMVSNFPQWASGWVMVSNLPQWSSGGVAVPNIPQRTSGGVMYYLLKVILEIISNINGHIVEQCTWPTMLWGYVSLLTFDVYISRELQGNSISQIPKHVFENLTELLHLWV